MDNNISNNKPKCIYTLVFTYIENQQFISILTYKCDQQYSTNYAIYNAMNANLTH
jgi:hypothetical protein